MGELSAIVDRLRMRPGAADTLPKGDWRAFLDEIRVCAEIVEQEIRSLRENQDRLLTIMNLIPVAFFVKDQESRFCLMNRACEETWGLSFADLVGTDGSQFFPSDQMKQFLATDQSIFKSHQPLEFEETYWSAAKQANRIGYTFKRPVYGPDGSPHYLVCVTLDITERKVAEAALLDSEARLREAIQNSPNPIIIHAEDGSIIMTSAALTKITGYTPEELPTTRAWVDKVFKRDTKRILNGIGKLYDLRAVRHEGEHPIVTASGDVRIWDFQSQPLPKLPDGRRVVLSLAVDVTDYKCLVKELEALATTDALTDLPNRRQFLARLADEFWRVQSIQGHGSTILMIDIDNFKTINDTYGHAVGDMVLQHFARLVQNVLGRIDIPGRIGGEEFAIILPGTGPVAAGTRAQRLREDVMKSPVVYQGTPIPVTVSIGITALDPGDACADDALCRADAALYQAKTNGRNRVETVLRPHDRRCA